MTLMDIAFRYDQPPGETELRALREIREVYGIWGLAFDEANRIVRVEYDASRLGPHDLAALLRNAGLHLREQVPLVPPSRPLAA